MTEHEVHSAKNVHIYGRALFFIQIRNLANLSTKIDDN